MRRAGKLFFIFALTIAMASVAAFFVPKKMLTAPILKDGDIIFQTSRSEQSQAILLASKSLYTHTGIIKHNPNGIVVIEAIDPVKETPLNEWVARGKGGKYVIYRYKGLNAFQAKKLFKALKSDYGKPYDIYFSFNNNKIYCSELVRNGYKAIGIVLGKEEAIGNLLISVPQVEELIIKRAYSEPECQKITINQCLNLIYSRQLVTPKSIANDAKLNRIYSNYPL